MNTISIFIYINYDVFPIAEQAALRRQARFQRFNLAPILASRNGGRVTRMQAVMIKKEKRLNRRNGGRKGKKKRGPASGATKVPPQVSTADNSDQPKVDQPIKKERKKRPPVQPQPTMERTRRSTACYGPSMTFSSTPTNNNEGEVRKIVQQLMEEMLTRVEKAAVVLNEAEKFHLTLDMAKEEQVKNNGHKRRASTDSTTSIKWITDQKYPVEEIVDLVKDETEQEEVVKMEEAEETAPTIEDEPPPPAVEAKTEAVTDVDEHCSPYKKRRSSFASSFYSTPALAQRSLRKANKVNYLEAMADEVAVAEKAAADSVVVKDELSLTEEDATSSLSALTHASIGKIHSRKTRRSDSITSEASSSPSKRSSRSQSLIESSPLEEEQSSPAAVINSKDNFKDEVANDSCSSSSDERPRRHLNNNLMLDASASTGSRVVFPMEVKACAVQRILDGATQVQVARDLQCPVSTVASWWHRRTSIIPSLASEDVAVNGDAQSVSYFLTFKNDFWWALGHFSLILIVAIFNPIF